MRDLGYTEGENIAYEFRSAEGKIAERAGPMTEEFIAKGVDVIVVDASALAKGLERSPARKFASHVGADQAAGSSLPP
jgi:hypothetical protein